MTKNNAMRWFRRNADKVDYYSHIQMTGFYFGRRFRLTDYDTWLNCKPEDSKLIEGLSGTILEIGSIDFDRWANSVVSRNTIYISKQIYPQVHNSLKESMLL